MQTAKTFLRQLGAWGTDLRHRYTGDFFFRTTVHVVGVQVALVIVLVIIFGLSLHYANQEVVQTVVEHIAKILDEEGGVTPTTLQESIGIIQTNITVLVFFGIVALAVVTGVILANVTLLPSRNALQNQKLFISNVAHELRTPLSTIKTLTEVSLFNQDLPGDVKRSLEETVEELDRASEIINNLLSLNQLLRPERIEFKTVDLGAVVSTAAGRLRAIAVGRGIDLSVKKDRNAVVWGNSSALEQVVTNIIRNSISYMDGKKHKEVHVSVEPDYRGYIVLKISDNGIGIAQKDLLHIFEPFYRADTSRTRHTQIRKRGSGLGLAIVNEIVRVHHGKIRIESALGKGTTTIVLLPIGPEVYTQAEQEQKRSDGVYEVSLDFSKEKGGLPYLEQPTNGTNNKGRG